MNLVPIGQMIARKWKKNSKYYYLLEYGLISNLMLYRKLFLFNLKSK